MSAHNALYRTHMATIELADELGLDLDTIRRVRRQVASGAVYLLGVCGRMAAGKDTVAEAVARRDGRDAAHLSLAAAVKDEVNTIIELLAQHDQLNEAAVAVARILGVGAMQAGAVAGLLWSDTRDRDHLPNGWQRTPTIRAALQYWGTDVRRHQDPDYWVRKLMTSVYRAVDAGQSVYVTDIRFPNEADAAAAAGFRLVRLNVSTDTQLRRLSARDGITVGVDTLNHASERALDGYDRYDLVVDNDDVELDDVVRRVETVLPNSGVQVA